MPLATALRHALEREGLHDELGRPNVVEAAVEGELGAIRDVEVAVRAAGPAVEVIDDHHPVRPEPLLDEVRVGVCRKDLGDRCVELPDDRHHRNRLVDQDLRLVRGRAHGCSPVMSRCSSSGIAARTASRRRYRSSASRR
jgi:hypothetical protein